MKLIRKDRRGLYNDFILCESNSQDIRKLCNELNNESSACGSYFIYSIDYFSVPNPKTITEDKNRRK